MTPDRRLDQLESGLADGLQKIDRLIEGQGKLTEIATRADQNADTAARGVANLTLQTQQGFVEVRQNFTQVDQNFTEVRQDIIQVDEKVDNLRAEMNQRFDQLITLIQERLS